MHIESSNEIINLTNAERARLLQILHEEAEKMIGAKIPMHKYFSEKIDSLNVSEEEIKAVDDQKIRKIIDSIKVVLTPKEDTL